MPGGGKTWFTVEYRPATNWDQSFTPNANTSQTLSGVIIHEIRDVGMPSDGPGWPKTQRVCYETTIPTPSTGDLDWNNERFAVRVIRADLNQVALGMWQTPGVRFSGTANVTVEAEVPLSTTTKSKTTLTIPISYRGQGNPIIIDVPSGDGAYELTLVAYGAENPAANLNEIVSSSGTAKLETLRFLLPTQAIADMGACIKSMADGIRNKKQWPPEREDHPNWRQSGINEIWVPERLPQLGKAIIKAVELEAMNSVIGGRVIDEAASKMGMLPSELRDFGCSSA
jgi:hypothetical protein